MMGRENNAWNGNMYVNDNIIYAGTRKKQNDPPAKTPTLIISPMSNVSERHGD
jgi:hypothetical protein